MKNLSIIDYTVFILMPVLAVVLSLNFKTLYLVSALLFYGMPALYAAVKCGDLKKVSQLFLFSSILSIPFAIIVDIIGTLSKVWYVPHSIFATRFLGIMPWEDFVWMIAATFTMVMLYEAFSKRISINLATKRMSYFVLTAVIALSVFISLKMTDPTLFIWTSKYTYSYSGNHIFSFPSTIIFTKNLAIRTAKSFMGRDVFSLSDHII